MNGLYLKVLLNLHFFFLFIKNMLPLFPDCSPFWSNSLNCTENPKRCSLASGGGTDLGGILKPVWKSPCWHTPASFLRGKRFQGWALLFSSQSQDSHTASPALVIISLLPLPPWPVTLHSPQATWRWLPDITKGSLPEPPVQSTGSPPARGMAYIQECSLKEHFFSPPQSWAISTLVLFAGSIAHSLVWREIRMNSYVLHRLFYEEGVKVSQRRQLCARKNIS